MAYEEALRTISLDADASLAEWTGVAGQPGSASPHNGKQFRFVKLTGAHQVGLATAAAGERVVGVLNSKPQVLGAAATVAIDGVSFCMAGDVVAAGQEVGPGADGRAVPMVGGPGVAQGSAAAGQLFPVLLRP